MEIYPTKIVDYHYDDQRINTHTIIMMIRESTLTLSL